MRVLATEWEEIAPSVIQTGKPCVDLSDVLDSICGFLQRHIVFSSSAQPIITALWIAHTWTLEAFDCTPYLHVWSPEKRCGKTKLLDCLELLVAKSWRAVSPSEAVLYRKIEADQPTLLLDEVDTVFSGNKNEHKEPLRALLNAGFERKAKVPRCVGQGFNYQVQEFTVFSAKAFAGIGRLPDTVADRCIPIRLTRRSRDEWVQRFRKREAEIATATIRAALETWSRQDGLIEKLRALRPEIPEELDDRQADICESLLAIADVAGADWPKRCRESLVSLCAADIDDDESIGVKLLSAIREAFNAMNADRLATKELLERLVNQDTDAPWAAWWEHDLKNDNIKGPGAKLAKYLKRYGIKSRGVRLGDNTTRGYIRENFTDAWKRYCPPQTG
jgi:Protein of unknown function (DUF3631)